MKVFSLLHATLGRPEKAAAAMRMWFDRAQRPELIEYVFACNQDDPTWHTLANEVIADRHKGRCVEMIQGEFAGSAPAWDAAAKRSTGMLLVQAQDDVLPPHSWDFLLLDAINRAAGYNPKSKPLVIAVSDGYRKDALMCTAIMSRGRYEQQGEFLHAGYQSVFSDDEFTYRAGRDSQAGICRFIYRPDLVFRHEHPYHNHTTPFDETYARENSAEAYALGERLFYERNPEARTDGNVTWR